MKALAEFIMRGRFSAILFIAGSSLVPLLGWLGSAAMALVVLRRGAIEGGVVMAGAALALAGLSLVVSGNPGGAALVVIMVWLPMIVVSMLLRETQSLGLALTASVGIAVLGLAIWHLLIPDPEAFWRARYGAMGGDMDAAQLDSIMASVSQYLAAFMALGLWANIVIGLLLGRAFQARLYNPGGFRKEFHSLRLDWRLAGATLAVLAGGMFAGSGLIYDMGLLLCGLFALQALAVIHAVVHGRGMSGAWLVMPYMLVPLAFMAVALLGILDTWFDIRRRLLKTPVAGDN